MRPALAFIALLAAFVLLTSTSVRGQASAQSSDPVLSAAQQARNEGRLADEAKILSDAIHQAEQNDPLNPHLAEYRAELVGVLHDEGRITDAEKIASEAVKQAEQIGSESPQLADALKQLARLLEEKGQLAQALDLEHRALEIDRNVSGPKDKSVVEDLALISNSLKFQRKYDEAEKSLEEALDITRLNPDISGEEKALVFVNLSQMYIGQRRWAEAEQLLLEAAKNCPNEKNGFPCSYYSYELAEVYRNEGRTAEANKLPSIFSSPEAQNLEAQAIQHYRNGQYSESEQATRRAIAYIQENVRDEAAANRQLAFEFGELGIDLHEQGRNEEAEAADTKAIELQLNDAVKSGSTATDGKGNSVFAFVTDDFEDLIDACRAANHLGDAEQVIQHVIDVQEKTVGERHPSMVPTLVVLANLDAEEGDADKAKYAQALPLYQRALAIREASVGPDDPRLTDVLTPYADLLRKMHRDSEAVAMRARIDALEKKDERNVAPDRTP